MAKIPITIITGFLGSGKTTLLQEVLQKQETAKIAVIVNELGEVGLDQKLLSQSIAYTAEKMLLLKGGCACCNRREDLVEALKDLLQTYQKAQIPLEHILIETTGLADPAPILFTILTDSFLCHHFTTHCVLTCIDSINGIEQINNNREAQNQIIISDKLILTKTDLQNHTQELKNAITALNPTVTVIDKRDLDHQNFLDLVTTSSNKHDFSSLSYSAHISEIKTLSLCFKTPIDWSAFGIWLSMLLHKYGHEILRVKGILDIGKDYCININGVLHIIHPPTHIPYNEVTKGSEMVFITKNLQPSRILNSLMGFASLLGSQPQIEVLRD